MTGEALKLVAVVCMLIDHVAWCWVPTNSVLGILMHCIGRITMPVMAFMIAEGYEHTHDITRYAMRLLIFAFASDIPFMFFQHSGFEHDVIYTLFEGLVFIWLYDRVQSIPLKIIGYVYLMALQLFFPSDWSVICVVLCFCFWKFRGNFKAETVCVFAMAISAFILYGQWWQFGLILSLPLLRLYNGQKGRGSKWGFYAFYPGHLAVLAALRAVI